MTEKRFTLHIKFYNREKTLGEATLKEMGQPLCRIESIEDARYIRDTLNELYDENQELQSRIKDYDNALKRLQDLTERKLEENEQLKKELIDANELNGIYVDFLVDKCFELSDVIEWSKRSMKND